MKTIARITIAAVVGLGGVLVATGPAQAAPHPSPSAYTHASSHAKFKRSAPLTHPLFHGDLPADWPAWAR